MPVCQWQQSVGMDPSHFLQTEFSAPHILHGPNSAPAGYSLACFVCVTAAGYEYRSLAIHSTPSHWGELPHEE